MNETKAIAEWQPMSTAPKNTTNVEILTVEGKQFVAHWAEQHWPTFRGWFIKVGSKYRPAYFNGINDPKAWRPLSVTFSPTKFSNLKRTNTHT